MKAELMSAVPISDSSGRCLHLSLKDEGGVVREVVLSWKDACELATRMLSLGIIKSVAMDSNEGLYRQIAYELAEIVKKIARQEVSNR